MKDSSFGQGKKIPPQFNDYMNIFRGLEEIVDTAYNQVEDRMLLEFRDVLSGSKEEANRTDEVIRYYMKVQRQNAKVSLDKFDLYMKDQFEPTYVAHKRQSHYRQLKQQQRRLINFDKLDLFDGIAEIQQAQIDFEQYIESFVDSVQEQVDMQVQKDDRKKQLDQLLEAAQKEVEDSEQFLTEFSPNNNANN